MPVLTMMLNGDGCWPDLPEKEVIHLGNDAPPIQIAALPAGMSSGKASVSLRLDLPDGRVVLAETSLALLVTAARAFNARFGEAQWDRTGPDVFDPEILASFSREELEQIAQTYGLNTAATALLIQQGKFTQQEYEAIVTRIAKEKVKQ